MGIIKHYLSAALCITIINSSKNTVGRGKVHGFFVLAGRCHTEMTPFWVALRVAPGPAASCTKLHSPEDFFFFFGLKASTTSLVPKKPTLPAGARKGFVGAVVSLGYARELRLHPASTWHLLSALEATLRMLLSIFGTRHRQAASWVVPKCMAGGTKVHAARSSWSPCLPHPGVGQDCRCQCLTDILFMGC